MVGEIGVPGRRVHCLRHLYFGFVSAFVSSFSSLSLSSSHISSLSEILVLHLHCAAAVLTTTSFSFPLVNAGGSISSSGHTFLKSASVKAPLGVALNSSSRFLRVVSAILTTCTISSTDLLKLSIQAARSSAAPQIPAGLRPRVIQS